MKKNRVECQVCNKRKDASAFDSDMDVCEDCIEASHRAALEYSAKLERDKNAPLAEKKERDSAYEEHRTSERAKAPPREYPYPWGPKKR